MKIFLKVILTKLIDKPGNVLNVDEIGLQINNKAGKVIVVVSSRNVICVTCGENGETISVLARVNG